MGADFLPGLREIAEAITRSDGVWRGAYVVLASLLSLAALMYGFMGIATVWGSAFKPVQRDAVTAEQTTSKVEPARTLREKLIEQRFEPVANDGDLERLEKPIIHDDKPYIKELDVRLLKAGEEFASLRVVNVHAECSWRFKSSRAFVYFPERTCPLEQILHDAVYFERLKLARDLVFVGMNSYPREDVGDEPRSQPVSQLRSVHLARLIDRVYPQLLKLDRHFWTLDLGRSTAIAAPKTLEDHHQRGVIVIGVDSKSGDARLSDILRFVVTTTRIGDVNLLEYDGSGRAEPSHVDSIWSDGTVHLDSTSNAEAKGGQ